MPTKSFNGGTIDSVIAAPRTPRSLSLHRASSFDSEHIDLQSTAARSDGIHYPPSPNGAKFLQMPIARPVSNGLRAVASAAVRTNDIRYFTCLSAKQPATILRHGYGEHRLALTARRSFIIDALPSVLVPPFVFTSLLIGLWTYKCMMTVLFQDKIIYMPYMPPFARGEKLEDYASRCRPVQWRQEHIKARDGTKIALCIGHIPGEQSAGSPVQVAKDVVICYFQGNGGSTPPRLPLLSNVLKSLHNQSKKTGSSVRYSLVALSYRGYWTSSGRASQRGIELDAQALLRWTQHTYGDDAEVILWGQSIGAGVASTAAASYVSDRRQTIRPKIVGLILETPFTSISSMLLALYPQKWLPYRYLSIFLWNHWDTEVALRHIVGSQPHMRVLLLPATRDEVVPPEEADKLERICHDLHLSLQREDIVGALHTEAITKRDGQKAVARFIIERSRSD